MNNFYAFLFSTCFFYALKLNAVANYEVIVDYHYSPYMGAEDIITLERAFILAEDKLIHRPPAYESTLRFIGRGLELGLWNLFNNFLTCSQHEIFGHGYRIRDLGSKYAKVKKYEFNISGASTHFSITPELTVSQWLAIDIGGVEATSIMANRMRLKWIQGNAIDGRQASLYNSSQMDLTNYCLSLDKSDFLAPDLDGNDMKNYLYYLKVLYPDGNLSKRQLRYKSLFNFLDPFLYFSLYSELYFMMKGKTIAVPMIPIKGYRYLPSFRLGLTPFGPEFFLENFLSKGNSPSYFYLKMGEYGSNKYYGLGYENSYVIIHDGLSIGFRLDIWRQPRVLFEEGILNIYQIQSLANDDMPIPQLYSTATLQQKRLGFALSAILEKRIATSPYGLFLQLGGKTKGYLPGESLKQAPILRGGFSATF